MRELKAELNLAVSKEYTRANQNFPMFHSNHEALGVIDEEVAEALHEIRDLKDVFSGYRAAVHGDNVPDMSECLADMIEVALLGACELIQVAAMCDKAIESKEMF